ncbi:Uncharacterized protein HZ326_18950 [Fusarium oxysporum f. sp. albedinis]|nr:ATP-dependent DNA helicase [Fusarium oxysporum f. sp. albedinis]KAJ0138087.1 Uncharacterized protein HZ326_18950 [Fusarium oxysporum f. sp. albedinis]
MSCSMPNRETRQYVGSIDTGTVIQLTNCIPYRCRLVLARSQLCFFRNKPFRLLVGLVFSLENIRSMMSRVRSAGIVVTLAVFAC